MNTETKHTPQISIFHHKHGVSFGLVPAGIEPEDFWRERDGYDPDNGEGEEIESIALCEPYASAPDMAKEIEQLKVDKEELVRTAEHCRTMLNRCLLLDGLRNGGMADDIHSTVNECTALIAKHSKV